MIVDALLDGPPGAFGLVAKKQFVEPYKNTAVLLGLVLKKGGEWGGRLAGRMWCFCSEAEEFPPRAVICEWSWMEKLQELYRVAP